MSEESSRGLAPLLTSGIVSAGPRIGVVAGFDPARGLLVEYEGCANGPIAARSIVALDAAAIERAVTERRAAVLLFENGELDRPILVGLVEPINPTPLLDLIIAETAASSAEVPAPQLVATVDGKRVVVEAEDEIELRCGKASITMRRNGRVVIRGAYVETHAEGVNRIKGGSVAIN